MDWDKLRIFHAVAEKGSLTHAGEVCTCRNRRSAGRSARWRKAWRHAVPPPRPGLILTEQGELLFDATQAMVKRLDATAARIRDSEDEVLANCG
jgi:DNA-binding transcriptional LysR family regulator